MYCRNCGKETNDAASFCPYCGAKTAAGIPAVKKDTVNPASTVRINDAAEDLPVYKRKNKAALLVALLPLIYVICKVGIAGWLTYGLVSGTQLQNSYSVLEYVAPVDILENNEGGVQ